MKKLKTKEELLYDFKKANKNRRLVLANRAGFDTPDEYRQHLIKQISSDTEVTVETITPHQQPLDMVIAFDTTGSMSSYLKAVKNHINELLKEVFVNSGDDLRIKIIAFGDYCDMESSNVFGNAFQQTDLTNNQNDLINFVNNAKDTAGCDTDEFYEVVLQKVIDETRWRDNSRKTLFLVGDANPHSVGYSYGNIVRNSQIDWRKEVLKYVEKGVTIDTLSIHGFDFYKTISRDTNGVNIPFRNANKMQEIVKGITYARTSEVSFKASMDSAIESGDSELIGAYKTMSSLI